MNLVESVYNHSDVHNVFIVDLFVKRMIRTVHGGKLQ